MRKFLEAIASFFSKVAGVAKRVFSRVAIVLRDASIALSGATSSLTYMGTTVLAIMLGMPISAAVFATFTVLAMWGTMMYRDQVEQERLTRGLYVVRATTQIAEVYGVAREVRRHRRMVRGTGNY